MRKRKLIIISILVIGAIISIIYIATVMKKDKTSPASRFQQGSSLPPDRIPSAIKLGTSPIIKESVDMELPTSLPLLEVSKRNPLSETEIINLGKNLAFTNQPKIGQDPVNGNAYFFNNDTNYLIVWQKQNKIRYGNSQIIHGTFPTIVNKQLSDQKMAVLAKDFIKKNFDLTPESLNYSQIIYLKTSPGHEYFEQTDRSSAEFFRVNLSPTFDDIPIITQDPKNNIYFIDILKDGTIFQVELNIPGEIKPSLSKSKIKNYEEINNTLNESVIVSVGDGNYDPSGTKPEEITNITIGKIETAYLYLGLNSDLLQPYFILTGTADIAKLGNNLKVDLLLPALSRN